MVCTGLEVIGYYSLSAGAISQEAAPKAMRRNMPDPLPILLLGRLAVVKRYHNQGIGQALLRDAMLRAVSVAVEAGVFAVLVHALTDSAKQFYLSRLYTIPFTTDDPVYDHSHDLLYFGRTGLTKTRLR